MSELSTLCDKVLECTRETLDLLEQPEPQIVSIAEKIQERSALFSAIQELADSTRADILAHLSTEIQPLDAKILEWMREHQRSLAVSLNKVKSGHARNTATAPAQILIQSA